MEPSQRDVTANGLRLRVLEWDGGGRTTLLCLHGFLDFAWAFHGHGLIVVARCDFLRGLRDVLHRLDHRSGDKNCQHDRDGKSQYQCDQQRLQQSAEDRIAKGRRGLEGQRSDHLERVAAIENLASGIEPMCVALIEFTGQCIIETLWRSQCKQVLIGQRVFGISQNLPRRFVDQQNAGVRAIADVLQAADDLFGRCAVLQRRA